MVNFRWMLVITMLIGASACGGGGGSSDPSDSDGGGESSSLTTIDDLVNRNDAFDQLDSYLASIDTVASDDIDGLWIFYTKGHFNLETELDGVTTTNNQSVAVSALIVHLQTYVEDGVLKLGMDECSRAGARYIYDSVANNEVVYDRDNNKILISLSQLVDIAGTSGINGLEGLSDSSRESKYTYDPSGYSDQMITVNVIDNRELQFDRLFSYEAEYTGKDVDRGRHYDSSSLASEFTVKARKIKDDIFASLGELMIGSDTSNVTCHSFVRFRTEIETEGTGAPGITDFFRFSADSYPTVEAGISSFSYGISQTEYPQQSYLEPEKFSISLANTSDLFIFDVSSSNGEDETEFDLTVGDGLNFSGDYSIYDSSIDTGETGYIYIDF